MEESEGINRRKWLKLGALGGVAAIAGCTTNSGDTESAVGMLSSENESDFLESFGEMQSVIIRDLNTRSQRHKKLKVVRLANDDEFLNDVVPEGTMMVFLEKGSVTESEFKHEQLLEKNSDNEKMLRDALKQVVEYSENPKDLQMSSDELGEILGNSEIMAKINYGSKTIASNIYTSDEQNNYLVSIPYNGGAIHEDDFHLEEFYNQNGEATSLGGIVYLRPPKLNPIEQAALDKCPPIEWYLNLGIAPVASCPVSTWIFVAAVAVYAATKAAGGRVLPDYEGLSQERIDALGNRGTAIELLKIRESILNGEDIGG